MSNLEFHVSTMPTLGVEIELALVDAHTMALKSASREILGHLPPALQESVKPELMQCYLEINTGVCATVSEAEADLRAAESAKRDEDVEILESKDEAIHPARIYGELRKRLARDSIVVGDGCRGGRRAAAPSPVGSLARVRARGHAPLRSGHAYSAVSVA